MNTSPIKEDRCQHCGRKAFARSQCAPCIMVSQAFASMRQADERSAERLRRFVDMVGAS